MRTRSKLRILAGAAKEDITPTVGTPLSGFIARIGNSTGIANRLYTRALILSSRGTSVAVVQMDLLGLANWHVQFIRHACRTEFGIPPEHVLLHATHTHSGPGVVPLRGCVVADAEYQWSVVNKTIAALRRAWQSWSQAELRIAKVPFELGINRRQETSEGVVLGVAPEKSRPESLDVISVECVNGQRHFLFSHAAHPYIFSGESTLISGDFPSFACEALEEGRENIALFLNGCAGDIAPKHAFEGLEAAKRVGTLLAEAVLDAGSQATAIDGDTLTGDSALVHLPHCALPKLEEIEHLITAQERTVRPSERGNFEVQNKISAAYSDWAQSIARVIRRELALDPVVAEVQRISIGDANLIGISGEPFFDIGQQIMNPGAATHTIALGYCNAYTGYLPTAAEYRGGGYEVDESYRYLGTWKLDPQSEMKIVRAGRSLLGGGEVGSAEGSVDIYE